MYRHASFNNLKMNAMPNSKSAHKAIGVLLVTVMCWSIGYNKCVTRGRMLIERETLSGRPKA